MSQPYVTSALREQVSRLTESQKQCLRLTAKGLTSKEIAYKLGLSNHTVDRYMHQAIQTLNVLSRRDAARVFEAFDFENTSSAPTDRLPELHDAEMISRLRAQIESVQVPEPEPEPRPMEWPVPNLPLILAAIAVGISCVALALTAAIAWSVLLRAA